MPGKKVADANVSAVKHTHIDSIKLVGSDTEKLKAGFKEMKEILGKRNIAINDIVSLVSSADIKDAAHKVSIRVSEDSVSQMNMIAFD